MINAIPITPDPSDEPRRRILAAATRLFAEHGFQAATLRMITDLAGVNIAAVNYYFRSKDELISRVLESLIGPLQARRAILEEYERSLDGRQPEVEPIIEALITPTVRLGRDPEGGRPLVKLLLQVRAMPRDATTRVFTRMVDPIAMLFIDALTRALPELPREVIFWRYNFALGALLQVLTDSDPATRRLTKMSGGLCDTDDDDAIIAHLVAYISGGLRAPVPEVKRSPAKPAQVKRPPAKPADVKRLKPRRPETKRKSK